MVAIRHITTAEDGYLNAALANIVDVGLRRTTITDIAKRAGVARMTIYRSWPDMTALLADLMVREWSREIESITRSRPKRALTADEIADLVVQLVQSIRRNALFAAVRDTEPDTLLPYLTERRGRNLDFVLDFVEAILRESDDAGLIRDIDPSVSARAIILASTGFVLSMATMIDATNEAALDRELKNLIGHYL